VFDEVELSAIWRMGWEGRNIPDTGTPVRRLLM
jgi:hypothetical protein